MPVHLCAYSVPCVHWETFQKALDHMVELSILKPCGASEWASPAFIIPEKTDGLTNHRLMLPQQSNCMQTIPFTNNHRYAGCNIWVLILYQTSISMQYYGQVQPKSLCNSHAIQQAQIQTSSHGPQILSWLYKTGYCGGIAWHQQQWNLPWQRWCQKMSSEHHILLLDKILHKLEANDFTVNPLKDNGRFRTLIGLDTGSHPQA